MDNEWLLRLLSLMAVFVFVGYTVVLRIDSRSWFAPGPFFAITWLGYSSISLFAYAQPEVIPIGLYAILGFVLIVAIGSIVGSYIDMRGRKKMLHDDKWQWLINLKHLSFFVILFSFLGALGVLVLLQSEGRSVIALFDMSQLAEVGRKFSESRYADTSYREPELAVFFSTFVYCASFLGGCLYAAASSPYFRCVALIPIIVGMLYAMVLTTRANIYFNMIFWFSSLTTTSLFRYGGRLRLFTFLNVFRFIATASLLFGSYIFLQMTRWGYDNIGNFLVHEDFSLALAMFTSAFLGSPVLFAEWFSGPTISLSEAAFGHYTTPFPRLLGLTAVEKYASTQIGVLEGSESTVFTLFRDIIEDYTIFGAILLFFLLGLIAGFSYKMVCRGRLDYLSVLCAFYCITIGSLTGMIFRYTTTISAWTLFFLIIFLLTKKSIRT